MNIIIINDYAHINGGAGQVAISSAVGLAKAGHNVILFTCVGPIGDELKNIDNLRVVCLNQYDILNDPNRLRAIINGLWNRYAASCFEELLHTLDRKNTIVHIHGCSKAISSSCVYTANKLGFKILYHLHDYGAACPNLGFYNYQKQRICNINSMSGKCLLTNCDSRSYSHKVWRCVRQLIQTQIGGLPSKIKFFVAVSRFSHKIMQPYLPSDSKVFFVANPINVSRQGKVAVDKNKFIIFIGRLTPEKNPMLLAKAAAELNFPVMFVGDGICKNAIKDIYQRAVITGWLAPEEVKMHIQTARALALTSSWYETQGLVVLEAAALGVPSIVPDTCAARDFITNGETGLIFKSNNIEDLKTKLIKLHSDDLVRYLGKNTYDNFWENPMTMERYVSEIVGIYEEILSN